MLSVHSWGYVRRMRVPRLVRAVIVVVACAATLYADEKAEIGFTSLQSRLGTQLPTGSGIQATQVEADPDPDEPPVYFPNPESAEFAGKMLTPQTPNPVISSHATTVGGYFYGLFRSTAPGINTILAYEANDWLAGGFLAPGRYPLTDGSRVQNHSWIGGSPTDATAIQLLRRVDYAVQRDGIVVCAGVNNGDAAAMPVLVASAYNVLAVGLTNGGSSYGPTRVEGGRVKPDLVAPLSATSWATPVVAACAALLLETEDRVAPALGAVPKALLARTLLMAGATKDEFAYAGGWRKGFAMPSTDGKVPFDYRFGAGELNIDNSHRILTAGEYEPGGAATVASTGWDYGTLVAGTPSRYFLDIPPFSYADTFSVVLAWNRRLLVSTTGSYFPMMANLDLRLAKADGFQVGSLVDQSVSTVDNVEHIFARRLPPGRYVLEVTSITGWPYALAWETKLAPTVKADLDGDGDVDMADVGVLTGCTTGPSLGPVPVHCQTSDLDADADVDQDDFGIMQRCLTSPGVVPDPVRCP